MGGGTGPDCPEAGGVPAFAGRGERERVAVAAGFRLTALGSPEAAIASGLVSTTTVGGAVPMAAGKSCVVGAAICKIPGPDAGANPMV